ncbi:MAG: hypothetical protein ABEH90_01820 [Halolamina sp.]
MQRSRRTVLAAVPTLLAGCGRSFRQNSVPGGLFIENQRDQGVTVTVKAAPLPPMETPVDGTPSPTPETPADEVLESPTVSGTHEVAAGNDKGVPDFFPEAGRWAVEATVEDGGGGRARIELHAAIPGPTGADTVHIQVTPEGVTAEASTVD